MLTHIPQELLPVEMLASATDAAGRSSAYFSLKNAKRAFIVVHILQGNAATILLTPFQAVDVAGTGTPKAISVTNIWTNLDTAAGSAFTRQAAAANYTTDNGVKHKYVVFEVGPNCMDIGLGFDCIRISTGASDVANLTEATLYIDQGYEGANVIDPRVD